MKEPNENYLKICSGQNRSQSFHWWKYKLAFIYFPLPVYCTSLVFNFFSTSLRRPISLANSSRFQFQYYGHLSGFFLISNSFSFRFVQFKKRREKRGREWDRQQRWGGQKTFLSFFIWTDSGSFDGLLRLFFVSKTLRGRGCCRLAEEIEERRNLCGGEDDGRGLLHVAPAGSAKRPM